ncbi:MAG: acyl carrier protein [Desulfobacteraceae bacterium]|nr:MAG: acyl carrier protein [Desulfobacteraceae bacterium]
MTMDRNDIFLFIKKYFVDTFEIPEKKINLKSSLFEDLELDSIDALDMVGMLEAEMNIETNEKELKTIITVQDVVDYIIAKTSQQNNADLNSQATV